MKNLTSVDHFNNFKFFPKKIPKIMFLTLLTEYNWQYLVNREKDSSSELSMQNNLAI